LPPIGEEALSVLHFVSPNIRHYIARADGVDANAMFDGFERQRPRQLHQCALDEV
jgi:hypothetical protein